MVENFVHEYYKTIKHTYILKNNYNGKTLELKNPFLLSESTKKCCVRRNLHSSLSIKP